MTCGCTHLCSHCCVNWQSLGSRDSCRSPLCSYRCRFHRVVFHTRPRLKTQRIITVSFRITTVSFLKSSNRKKNNQTQLTNTHWLVSWSFEPVRAEAAVTSQCVNTLTRIADTRDLIAFITIWKEKQQSVKCSWEISMRIRVKGKGNQITINVKKVTLLEVVPKFCDDW